jgi:hypothetical protein
LIKGQQIGLTDSIVWPLLPLAAHDDSLGPTWDKFGLSRIHSLFCFTTAIAHRNMAGKGTILTHLAMMESH